MCLIDLWGPWGSIPLLISSLICCCCWVSTFGCFTRWGQENFISNPFLFLGESNITISSKNLFSYIFLQCQDMHSIVLLTMEREEAACINSIMAMMLKSVHECWPRNIWIIQKEISVFLHLLTNFSTSPTSF